MHDHEKELLRQLLESYGASDVVSALSRQCARMADHIRDRPEDESDEPAAKAWSTNAATLEAAAFKMIDTL